MNTITFFKLQAKNLFKDFKTKSPVFDEVINDYLYEYTPQYFDIDRIILEYDVNEDKFTLMKAQHIISNMAGFSKWADLLNCSPSELELAKLLFDNQHKIHIEEWFMYVDRTELENSTTFDAESRLEIFKEVFVNVDGHYNSFGDYRLR